MSPKFGLLWFVECKKGKGLVSSLVLDFSVPFQRKTMAVWLFSRKSIPTKCLGAKWLRSPLGCKGPRQRDKGWEIGTPCSLTESPAICTHVLLLRRDCVTVVGLSADRVAHELINTVRNLSPVWRAVPPSLFNGRVGNSSCVSLESHRGGRFGS